MNYPLTNSHSLPLEIALESLQSDRIKGLGNTEAQNRLKTFGPNIYHSQKQKSIGLILLLQFKSAIVYILLFAAAITFFFHDYAEAISILVVILLNALIGFSLELQARNSMAELKKMDVILSKVIRDGQIRDIPSQNIVPGDIIVFEAGDIIAADARVIAANALECDESSLTGESVPNEKKAGQSPQQSLPADQFNMVFKGTYVVNGNGSALVTGTALNTQIGAITALVESSEETETPLNIKIGILSKKLIWVTLLMTVIFAATSLIQGKSWLLILQTSIALAVAAIPEGLPIVATVALAYGVLQMGRKNAIVKNLSSVETLGGTDIILTDKTGTLTENKISTDTIVLPEKTYTLYPKGSKDWFSAIKDPFEREHIEKLLLIGVLCNNAKSVLTKLGQTEFQGDPLETALLETAGATGFNDTLWRRNYERIDEIPFSSDTKIMGTLHSYAGKFFVAAKGSVEHLLERCSKIQDGLEIRDLNPADRSRILAESDLLASRGLRGLAFAYRNEDHLPQTNVLQSMVYAGMVGFMDPPRTDIKDALTSCRSAGIKLVMVTGDHPLTALNIGRQVGLLDPDNDHILTGTQLPDLNAEEISVEWRKKILETSIFARTTPRQKLDLVTIYQQAGHVVGMTGDGINDAPALKKADIGIAMGFRGTQVARETADIVLKDDSFNTIALAVAYGREIFQNIQKFVVYLVSCNMSEIFVVTSLGFLAPASTLWPIQILFLNMVTDVFPALALGLGRGNTTVMNNPPRDPKKLIITNRKWLLITVYALLITSSVILAEWIAKSYFSATEKELNHVVFITLALAQLFHVFNMASGQSGIWINEITKNKFVWLAIFICTMLLAMVFVFPGLRFALKLEALPADLWILSVSSALIPLLAVRGYQFARSKKKIK